MDSQQNRNTKNNPNPAGKNPPKSNQKPQNQNPDQRPQNSSSAIPTDPQPATPSGPPVVKLESPVDIKKMDSQENQNADPSEETSPDYGLKSQSLPSIPIDQQPLVSSDPLIVKSQSPANLQQVDSQKTQATPKNTEPLIENWANPSLKNQNSLPSTPLKSQSLQELQLPELSTEQSAKNVVSPPGKVDTQSQTEDQSLQISQNQLSKTPNKSNQSAISTLSVQSVVQPEIRSEFDLLPLPRRSSSPLFEVIILPEKKDSQSLTTIKPLESQEGKISPKQLFEAASNSRRFSLNNLSPDAKSFGNSPTQLQPFLSAPLSSLPKAQAKGAFKTLPRKDIPGPSIPRIEAQNKVLLSPIEPQICVLPTNQTFKLSSSSIEKRLNQFSISSTSIPSETEPQKGSQNQQWPTVPGQAQQQPDVGRAYKMSLSNMGPQIPGMRLVPNAPPLIQQTPGCPPGLESLIQIDQFMVQRLIELTSSSEIPNHYSVIDITGQQIFYVQEKKSACSTIFLKPYRNLELLVRDNYGREVMRIKRSSRCFECPCWCSLQEIHVYASGEKLGTIKQNWTFCYPQFSVYDDSNVEHFKIKGSNCIYGWRQDIVLRIHRIFDNKQIGQISQQWPRQIKTVYTESNRFGAKFPLDLAVKLKAILIGAALMTDYMFFERKRH